MNDDMHLFLRQKGRSRGNNFKALCLSGHGKRAAQRKAERQAMSFDEEMKSRIEKMKRRTA